MLQQNHSQPKKDSVFPAKTGGHSIVADAVRRLDSRIHGNDGAKKTRIAVPVMAPVRFKTVAILFAITREPR